MNTVWQSLLWKEWHENRWKLASLTVILFAVSIGASWETLRWFPSTAMGVSALHVLIAPIYIAAGVCASEASGGTLLFLQATPVNRRQWALAKLVMGWFTVAMPLLLLLSFYVACNAINPEIFGNRSHEKLEELASLFGSLHYFGLVGYGIMCAIITPMSVFIWSLAVGVKCRRELWAIAFSLGVLGGLWFLFFVLEDNLSRDGLIQQFALALLPGGFMIGFGNSLPASPTLPVFLAALVFYVGLLRWFLSQFGQFTRHAGHSPKAVMVCDPTSVVIRKPHKSKTSAILWMQMREIAPLALASIALILLPALPFTGFLVENFRGDSYAERLGNFLMATTRTLGFLFATLIGVGVFLRDLEPGLNTFWRSRPVPASHWFWTKFLSAFAMLAIAVGIPAILTWILLPSTQPLEMIFVAGFVTSGYTTAVAVTALVRHAIYGCLLSIGISATSFLVTYPMVNDWGEDNEAFYVAESVLGILLIAVTTLIAWLAVTRDWGWKR